METSADTPVGGSRHWWLQMLGLSAALALLLLMVAGAARPLYRRYRAWRYPPEYVRKIYDVRDLVMPIANFCDPAPPPEPPGLRPSGRASWPALTAADLTKAIRERLGPDAWPEGKTSLDDRNGTLIIVQTPEAHAEVLALLEEERSRWKRVLEIEPLFVKGAGLGQLLEGLGATPGAVLSSDQAARLIEAARGQGAQIVRPDGAAWIEGWGLRDTKGPAFRCRDRQVLRLTSARTVNARAGGERATGKVVTGFALEVCPVFTRRGDGFVLCLHPSYCGLLPAAARSAPLPALDERQLWTTVSMSGGGWTALLLEPGRSARDRAGPLGPVLVLVGARLAEPDPPERELKL